MTRFYFLITNSSDCTYWSYLGDKNNTVGAHAEAVEKYGPIYINQYGGWMPKSAVKTIHKECIGRAFPQSVDI